ncbi:MAG: tRNA lysidine(34) synthetase TilS [Firmicutes bacterium]|nr:tRNA lysidine(34) synthetase TilS [Bacillota bacterium]
MLNCVEQVRVVEVLSRVKATVTAYRMLEPGQLVLVAVSGGPDSVALLDILYTLREELGIGLAVAHFDHGLRPDSAADAEFVRELGGRYGLTVHVERGEVALRRAAAGMSPEEAARVARYEFLRRLAHQTGAQRVALGHHGDDQAETVLMNFLRGTGVAGLKGIPPVRDGLYVRPLLGLRRWEIEAYCAARGLAVRHDPSNRDPAFLRNRLRRELIPWLEERYNPGLVPALMRTAEVCRAEDEYLSERAAEAYRAVRCGPEGGAVVLDLAGLDGLPLALARRVIRLAWREAAGPGRPLEFEGVERLLAAARARHPAAVTLPGGLSARIARNLLVVGPAAPPVPPSFEYELRVPGITPVPELGLAVECDILPTPPDLDYRQVPPDQAFLDWDVLAGQPLSVRGRRPGDRFTPLGTGVPVRLKDFLLKQKVPRERRARLPLVATPAEIVWVGGVRPGEKVKVRPTTKRVLWLRLVPLSPPDDR